MDNKIKHLEMITKVVERMSSNSFMLKGWGITIVAALFALANKDMNQDYLLFAYVPLAAFWFLDSYYLQIERKFKALYKIVCAKSDDEIDFSMDTRNIQIENVNDKRLWYVSCLFSTTEWLFYVPIIAIIALILICL